MRTRLASISVCLAACALGQTASADTKLPAKAKDDNVYPVYDSNWAPYVALGAQFLPDYDENGRSSGLSKQQFFAMLTVDGRFGDESREFHWSNPFRSTFNTGVTLSLLGTPVKRDDKPSISPNEFNDVAKTIVSSAYLFLPAFDHAKGKHSLGPIARAGAISRETLGERGDSVNWFYSVGVQYASERFMNPTYKANNELPTNGIPEGYLRLSAARFEDYAGLGTKTRLVGDAALRVYPKLNLFLGVQGNFGKGPDELMLVVSMARAPQEIANLFALGKTE